MRAIWSGAIAFGLVNIPVKLFSAIKESRIDFDMLDKKDHSNIKFKRVNENTGKEVTWKNIVKGYDLNGKYVVLTDSDFEKASPEKTKLIELEAFVDPAQIDVILYDSAYYLQPAKGGERAYVLLEQALSKAGKNGIGTFVLRNRERPVAIRAAQGILIVHTLRFINEIRDPSAVAPQKTTIKKNELGMARNLVSSLESKFDIKAYKDNYSLQLMKFIKAKASGKKLSTPQKQIKEAPSDLLEQLQQSLSGNSSKAAKTPMKKAAGKKATARKSSPKKTPAKKKSPAKKK